MIQVFYAEVLLVYGQTAKASAILDEVHQAF